MIDAKYKAQVDLLLTILPQVAKEKSFALNGGTAINLFVRWYKALLSFCIIVSSIRTLTWANLNRTQRLLTDWLVMNLAEASLSDCHHQIRERMTIGQEDPLARSKDLRCGN